ncbi:MAG TPA: NADP oxidoreductase [Candidatus Krumholzibacteria bacterium]|nr:NADP oxidoreductase [Candidatus Krumholzibacteria bacterium]
MSTTDGRKRLATIWLDGCSGCHMSFLDMDEALVDVAAMADVVYGPLVDTKEFPADVDVTLVEGGVSSEEDLEKIKTVRSRTKVLAALGDCAVTANVSGLRNQFPVDRVIERAYHENADDGEGPQTDVPRLEVWSKPLHAHVTVDLWIPGCPPSAQTIQFAVTELLQDRIPDLSEHTRFGA